MSQEKDPKMEKGSKEADEAEEIIDEILMERDERYPSGRMVSLYTIKLDEGAQEEMRLLTGAFQLLTKGEVYQENSSDPSKLVGEVDTKGNVKFTIYN